jgi:D-glycero-alpha-D-manno-heptose-7-phosphate kinase
MMTIVRARTPVRFCDLGGWTDIRIVERGSVLNLAAALYTTATVETGHAQGVRLESEDTGDVVEASTAADLDYDGKLDLLKAALRRSGPGPGIRITVRSDAPPASGLGSSAAVGVAAVAALAAALAKARLPYECAREAQALEVEELRLECGLQDQLAAAYGGINAMDVRYPEAAVYPIPIAPETLLELEDRLVLVSTGRSRFSSAVHEKVIAAYQSGQADTVRAFDALATCARRGSEALLRADLDAFADAINDNWAAQKRLHPDITTAEAESLAERARAAGALAFKLNGAGGGGTATLLCRRGRVTAVRKVAEELGMRVLPTKIDFSGLKVWRAGPDG